MLRKALFYIAAVVVVFLLIWVGVVVLAVKTFEERGFGKDLYIVIQPGETVDYKAVLDAQEHGLERQYKMDWPALCREEDIRRLAEFMEKNNYVIVPGTYHIDQTFTFAQMKRVLKFQKAE